MLFRSHSVDGAKNLHFPTAVYPSSPKDAAVNRRCQSRNRKAPCSARASGARRRIPCGRKALRFRARSDMRRRAACFAAAQPGRAHIITIAGPDLSAWRCLARASLALRVFVARANANVPCFYCPVLTRAAKKLWPPGDRPGLHTLHADFIRSATYADRSARLLCRIVGRRPAARASDIRHRPAGGESRTVAWRHRRDTRPKHHY